MKSHLFTDEEDQSARQHAPKDGQYQAPWRHEFTIEIAKNGNAEAFKDVIGVEQTGKNLGKVADYIVPADRTSRPGQ